MKAIYTTLLSMLLVAVLSVTCKRKEAVQPEEDVPPVAAETVIAEIRKMLTGIDSLSHFSLLVSHGVFPENTDFSKGATFLAPINQPGGLPISKEDIASYVIAEKVDVSQLTHGSVLTTVSGEKVQITKQSGKLFGNGAQLSQGELKQGSYIVIPIDRQLPYSSKGFPSRVCGDPNDGSYYLSYYANGKLVDWSGAYPTAWETVTGSGRNIYYSGCEALLNFNAGKVSPTFRNSGAWISPVPPFYLGFSATNSEELKLPKVGTYRISGDMYDGDALVDRNRGTAYLVMAGHQAGPSGEMPISPYSNQYQFVCGKDSYVEASITTVKIENELPDGHYIGYYEGTFHAILYGPSRDERQKMVITNGRFRAPILPFNCVADKPMQEAPAEPQSNRFELLTSGRWSLRCFVENYLEDYARNPEKYDYDPPASLCNKDDYFVFRSDGTWALVDGGVQCTPEDGLDYFDSKGHQEPVQWRLVNDDTIHVPGQIWHIVRMNDQELVYYITEPDYPGYNSGQITLIKD